MMSKTNLILLAGDFNARTGVENDFYDFSNDRTVDNSGILGNFYDLSVFGFEDTRKSCDLTVSTYGKLLLDTCRSLNMFIMNGRLGENKNGLTTCKDVSVVDYFICTYDVIIYLNNMQVLETSSLFSDVHNPITLSSLKEYI